MIMGYDIIVAGAGACSAFMGCICLDISGGIAWGVLVGLSLDTMIHNNHNYYSDASLSHFQTLLKYSTLSSST